MTDDTIREIPHARGPEKSILSTLLKNPEAFVPRAKAEAMTAEHFLIPAHKTLFGRIMSRPVEELELITLVETMHKDGVLESVGGSAGISDIYTYATNSQHWAQHVRLLRESLAQRRLMADATRMLEEAPFAEPDEISRMLRKASESAADALGDKSQLTTAKEAVQALIRQMEAFAEGDSNIPGHATGMDPIDLVTGGMRAGDLWVIAGETSAGKSVGMIQAAATFLEVGKRVLIVSLEMEAWQVTARIASCAFSIDLAAFMFPRKANHGELTKAKTALNQMADWPLAIDDKGSRSIEEITGMAEVYRDRHGGLDLVVVDYVQLIEGRRANRNDTRESEVADITKKLKGMAKRLGCPVFTASQLNDNGKLRESRAIGHDADVVLAIADDGIKGLKVRNGERGQLFPLVLIGKYQRFESRNTQQ